MDAEDVQDMRDVAADKRELLRQHSRELLLVGLMEIQDADETRRLLRNKGRRQTCQPQHDCQMPDQWVSLIRRDQFGFWRSTC